MAGYKIFFRKSVNKDLSAIPKKASFWGRFSSVGDQFGDITMQRALLSSSKTWRKGHC